MVCRYPGLLVLSALLQISVSHLLANPSAQKEDAEESVKELYTARPYPSLAVEEIETCSNQYKKFGRQLVSPTRVRSAAIDFWNGVIPDDIRVLDAGSGTGEDCLLFVQELSAILGVVPRTWEVVCLDLSEASLAITQQRLKLWGITEAAWPSLVQGSYLNTTLMGSLGKFDLILAEGTLHHIRDPIDGFRSLAAMRRTPRSVLNVLAYQETARVGIAEVQRYFKGLQDVRNVTGTARYSSTEIALLRGYLRLLPAHSLLKITQPKLDFDMMTDDELADMFLHPMEHQFRVADIRDIAQAVGLAHLKWIHDAQFHPGCVCNQLWHGERSTDSKLFAETVRDFSPHEWDDLIESIHSNVLPNYFFSMGDPAAFPELLARREAEYKEGGSNPEALGGGWNFSHVLSVSESVRGGSLFPVVTSCKVMDTAKALLEQFSDEAFSNSTLRQLLETHDVATLGRINGSFAAFLELFSWELPIVLLSDGSHTVFEIAATLGTDEEHIEETLQHILDVGRCGSRPLLFSSLRDTGHRNNF